MEQHIPNTKMKRFGIFTAMLGVISLLNLISCNRMQNSTPPATFYTTAHRGDLLRLPLIDPYEAISIDGTEWSINLLTKEIQDELTITELDSVGVWQDKIVVITIADRYFAKHPFYVIDAKLHHEKAFDNWPDVQQYIAPQTIAQFNLQAIRSLYPKFDSGEKLPWVPGK